MGEITTNELPKTVSFEHKFFAMVEGITFIHDDSDGMHITHLPVTI